MKVKYISEGFFKNSAQMKKQIEKEVGMSDEDKISALANETLFVPIEKAMNEGFTNEILERFSDIAAIAIDAGFNDSLLPYMIRSTHICTDYRKGMIRGKTYKDGKFAYEFDETRFEELVDKLGHQVGNSLKFIKPVIWSPKSNADQHILDSLHMVSDDSNDIPSWYAKHIDDLRPNEEICNMIKSDKRIVTVRFIGNYPSTSYIDEEDKQIYVPGQGFNINFYAIVTGHDLDKESINEYSKLLTRYELNDNDPEIDKYFIGVFKEVAGGLASSITSDLQLFKDAFEEYLVERLYSEFIGSRIGSENSCSENIADVLKEKYPINVSLTICRATMPKGYGLGPDVKTNLFGDRDRSQQIEFTPIKGMNKYTV